jgi:hypothetical protein
MWAGVVAEKPGDVRECALTGPRRGRGGGGDLIGQAHHPDKEKGTRGATARQLANRARETERERRRARVKKSASTGRPH